MFGDFDPLKWLDDLIVALRYGSGVWLTWQAGAGWSGADAERLLRRYGVRVLRRRYTNGAGRDFGVMVAKRQATWADYLLRRAGVPMTSQARGAEPGVGELPVAWGRPASSVGILGRLVDWLG